MAVFTQYTILLLHILLLISSSLGHQSPAPPHSCSHGHNHHHDHHHHHHDHHHDHDDHHGTLNEPPKRKLLPEELAEEEDLKLLGFGSGHDHHHHGHGHGHGHDDDDDGSHSQLSGVGLWIHAMGCSLLVSLASLICLTIIPILCAHGKPSKAVVDSLALFGAGAMLGDAFLHQLPHAFSGGHSHDHGDHDHSEHSHSHSLADLSIGLSILFGIVVFLIVEKVVRFVEEYSGGEHLGAHAHHHHHKSSKKVKADKDSQKKSPVSLSKEKKSDGSESSDNDTSKTKQVSGPQSDLRKRNKTGDGKQDGGNTSNKEIDEAKPTTQPSNLVFGYLNLFSDGVHNFTDGMALGSAFLLYGSVGGWSRTLFLLAHEIPQEVGDFGILVRSGFSVSKALFFNFLSALVALAGTALALLMGQDPGQSSLIEGFTAGGFIYISVAGVLAEMNNNGSSSLKSSVAQLISLVLGMAVALGISLVE
ncbi:hypothetical protein vseg_000492 [Gypsophila vaccaria]